MTKVVVYACDQNAERVDAQIRKCRELVRERAWRIATVYTDMPENKTAGRPNFRTLLEAARDRNPNNYFYAIVVADFWNLTRTYDDLVKLQPLLATRQIHVVAASYSPSVMLGGSMDIRLRTLALHRVREQWGAQATAPGSEGTGVYE
jgi:DNA invertase Pin-like site-specific DNA recombinase